MERTRAYRRAQRARVIANRLREVRDTSTFAKENWSYYNQLKRTPGGLSKRKPYDCGNARCMICHSEKVRGTERAKYLFREPIWQILYEDEEYCDDYWEFDWADEFLHEVWTDWLFIQGMTEREKLFYLEDWKDLIGLDEEFRKKYNYLL